MSALPTSAAAALVDRETIESLDAVAAALNREQLIWSSGYLAGLAAARSADAALAPDASAADGADASAWRIL